MKSNEFRAYGCCNSFFKELKRQTVCIVVKEPEIVVVLVPSAGRFKVGPKG